MPVANFSLRHCLHIVAISVLLSGSLLVAQPEPQPRGAPPRTAVTPAQVQIYEAFRSWLTKQPVDVQRAANAVVSQRYAAELRNQGKPEKEIASTLELLRTMGDRAEIERWNRILTSSKPRFNTAPNGFVVEMTKGLKPGRALDVGMGQGRNAIYLAQQGWESVGFDPADRAVAAAQEQAHKLGVKITTHVTRAADFDWGEAKWDLIVLSYVGGREHVANVSRGLSPGGMVVLEAFHRDSKRPVGSSFDTNELLERFAGFRIVRYEDTTAVGDFGLDSTRVVRLAAVKQ